MMRRLLDLLWWRVPAPDPRVDAERRRVHEVASELDDTLIRALRNVGRGLRDNGDEPQR